MTEEYTMTGSYALAKMINEGKSYFLDESWNKYLEADRCIRISHIIPRINTSKVRAIARTKQRTLRARKEKMKKLSTINITKNRYSR